MTRILGVYFDLTLIRRLGKGSLSIDLDIPTM